jgi:hypothetical protein
MRHLQRIVGRRDSAVACPSCGVRRIRLDMRFCDQCGQRIPESLIRNLWRETASEPRKDDLGINRAPTGAEALPSPELPDRTDQSAPVQGPSDNTARSRLSVMPLRKEAARAGSEMSFGIKWGRQQVLGVFLIIFGAATELASAVIGVTSLAGLGLASFIIGLLFVFVESQRSFTPELVEAAVLSSLTNIERLLRELGPETKAVYLKVHDRLDVPMVFLPLEENAAPPFELGLHDEDRFFLIDSEDSHKTGLLLEAPGASLLALMEKESAVNFIDLERQDFLDMLKSSMVESLEVAADVKGTVTQEGVKFRIKDGALQGLSRYVTRSAPNVASRLGCPICSAAICAAVKVFKSDMILEEAVHQPRYHSVTLRFSGVATSGAS